MVLLGNADCLFVIFIVVRYSFLCYAIFLVTICEDQRRYNVLLLGACIFIIYCYLTHYVLVYRCNWYSSNFSPLFRCHILRSDYFG